MLIGSLYQVIWWEPVYNQEKKSEQILFFRKGRVSCESFLLIDLPSNSRFLQYFIYGPMNINSQIAVIGVGDADIGQTLAKRFKHQQLINCCWSLIAPGQRRFFFGSRSNNCGYYQGLVIMQNLSIFWVNNFVILFFV